MSPPKNLDDLLFVAYQSGRSDGREEALRSLLIELQQENAELLAKLKAQTTLSCLPEDQTA
jgi:hypothetical protein